MLILLAESDDERDMQARIVQRPFESRYSQAVICIKEDNCIVGQAVRFKLVEQLADLLVHKGYQVVIAGPDFPHKRSIGIVRRQQDFSRIVTFIGLKLRCVLSIKFLVGTIDLPLMCGGKVKHAEERLPRPAITPMGLWAGFVPDVDVDEVVVFLIIVRAVVARRPKIFGEAFDLFRQLNFRAQMLGSKRSCIYTRNQTRTGRRAYRSCRKRFGVSYAFASQPVKTRCNSKFITIAA